MKLGTLIVTVIIALGIITQLTQLRKDGKALKAEPDPQTKRKEVRVFVIFVVIGIAGAILIRENQEEKDKKPKIEKVNNPEIYPIRSKMPDISQEKKSDTIDQTFKIEPVEEITTTEKTESKIIDTTLQIVSKTIEMPINKKDEDIEKIIITERPPNKGHGLLIIRVTQNSTDHLIEYSIDGNNGYTNFRYDSNNDSARFYRHQARENLKPGIHNLRFYDGYGELYNQNIVIEEGKTYIKHFKHEYPFGEKIGKFLLLPSKRNLECDIIICDYNDRIIDSIRIKDKSFEWILNQGGYQYIVKPVNPTELHFKAKERFHIGAGHVTKRYIDD